MIDNLTFRRLLRAIIR